MLVQVAPGYARSRNPENPIQDKPVISRAPPATRTAFNHERLKTGPFLIAHQTTDQGSFPKSYLESEPTRFGNPLCQHGLVIIAALAASFVLSACNTTAGAGKDLQSAGKAVENTANDAKN